MPDTTCDVLVIGDGPVGASAALYLAKNGMDVHVLGEDHTPMHKAELHNQPGVPGMTGSEFMRITREQCRDYGANLHEGVKAVGVQHIEDAFLTRAEDDATYRSKYLVLATGRNKTLAESLALDESDAGVRIDIHGRTSHDKVYAGGNLARGITQCAISAGDGTAIALDILSREEGKPVHDYDVVKRPEKEQAA